MIKLNISVIIIFVNSSFSKFAIVSSKIVDQGIIIELSDVLRQWQDKSDELF